MIKERVDAYFRLLESAFEYKDGHVYLTDALEPLKSSGMDSLNQLALEAMINLGDTNPYDSEFENYFMECVTVVGSLLDKRVDEAVSAGVAALSYIGYTEGLLNLPVYNINCNSNEAYIEFLAHGNPVETTQLESVGDNTLDLINALRRNGLNDSNLERFVKSEYQLVEDQSQSLKTLIPWVPLTDPSSRSIPGQSLLEPMIQGDMIYDVCEKIQRNRRTMLTPENLLEFLKPDKETILRSFGDGDYLNDSIGGTYLIFLHGLLKGILEVNLPRVELLPMVKYVRDSITRIMPTRLNNRYVLLGLMTVNAVIGELEMSYFNKYSEDTKLFMDSLINRYKGSLQTEFMHKHGICKHGVPDDIYVWMTTCLKSTVLPESTKDAIRDESQYPAIGPVRLLFDSTEFGRVNASTEASSIPLEQEKICESMVRSLIEAVDPSGVESPTSRVDSPVGESGATELSHMIPVLEALHKESIHARSNAYVKETANIVAAQKLVLESVINTDIPDVDSQHMKSVVEATLKDIDNGERLILPYAKLSSFKPIMVAANANASTVVQETLKSINKKG